MVSCEDGSELPLEFSDVTVGMLALLKLIWAAVDRSESEHV